MGNDAFRKKSWYFSTLLVSNTVLHFVRVNSLHSFLDPISCGGEVLGWCLFIFRAGGTLGYEMGPGGYRRPHLAGCVRLVAIHFEHREALCVSCVRHFCHIQALRGLFTLEVVFARTIRTRLFRLDL